MKKGFAINTNEMLRATMKALFIRIVFPDRSVIGLAI
jgi:hypothetical protein